MSFTTVVCSVCGETYTFGVVGTAMVGSGHVCPVKVQRDRMRDALGLLRGYVTEGEGRKLIEDALWLGPRDGNGEPIYA